MATSKSTTATVDADATETAEPVEPTKTMAEQVSELAEMAVIVPIGAGLVVRDDLAAALRKLQKKYATSAGLEKELTRYEKRGAKARKSLEKQVRAQRKTFEKGMKARRKEFEKHSNVLNAKFEELVSSAQGLIS